MNVGSCLHSLGIISLTKPPKILHLLYSYVRNTDKGKLREEKQTLEDRLKKLKKDMAEEVVRAFVCVLDAMRCSKVSNPYSLMFVCDLCACSFTGRVEQ